MEEITSEYEQEAQDAKAQLAEAKAEQKGREEISFTKMSARDTTVSLFFAPPELQTAVEDKDNELEEQNTILQTLESDLQLTSEYIYTSSS